MDPKAPANAPYVLMVNTGAAGRFNRAQRAAFNMDEGLPLFISSLVLAGLCFGPVAMLPALFSFFGRIKFANDYKEDLERRGAGFLPAILATHVSAGMVLIAAVKGFMGPAFPF